MNLRITVLGKCMKIGKIDRNAEMINGANGTCDCMYMVVVVVGWGGGGLGAVSLCTFVHAKY